MDGLVHIKCLGLEFFAIMVKNENYLMVFLCLKIEFLFICFFSFTCMLPIRTFTCSQCWAWRDTNLSHDERIGNNNSNRTSTSNRTDKMSWGERAGPEKPRRNIQARNTQHNQHNENTLCIQNAPIQWREWIRKSQIVSNRNWLNIWFVRYRTTFFRLMLHIANVKTMKWNEKRIIKNCAHFLAQKRKNICTFVYTVYCKYIYKWRFYNMLF